MTTTPTPLPPLAEAIEPTLALAKAMHDRGAVAALEAVLTLAPDYEAERDRLRGLLREAMEALSTYQQRIDRIEWPADHREVGALIERIQEATP